MTDAAAEIRPALALPKLPALAVGGSAAGWGDAGLRITAFAEDAAVPVDPALLRGSARLGWTDEGLAVLVELRSAVPWVESAEVRTAFEDDSIELFLRRGSAWRELVQPVIAPGLAPGQPEPRCHVWDYRGPPADWRDAPLTVRMARTRIDGGCVLEVLVPWSGLRFAAMPGAECEFRLNLNKRLPGLGRRQLVWRGSGGEQFHRLVLGDRAEAPVDTAAWAQADENGLTAAVVAPASSGGRRFSLHRDGAELASGLLRAVHGRAEGWLALPPDAADGSAVEIRLAGRVVGSDRPAHPREALRDRLRTAAHLSRRWHGEDPVRERLVPRVPAVFRGPELPQAASPDASLAALAGITAVETRWFDAAFAPVSSAARPGRHGAVIIVRLGDEVLELRRTCWVMAPGDDGASGAAIAASLGLSASAAGDRASAALLGEAGLEGLRHRCDAAVLLAGLADARAGEAPRAEARDRAWWHALRTALGTQTRYGHFRLLPKGYDADPARRWPAILYLHGSGGRFPSDYTPVARRVPGGDLHGWAAGRGDLPFVIYSLQACGPWEPPAIIDSLERILAEDRVDPGRVIVMGFSMGGIGAWDCAVDHPGRWAAAVPLGGRAYRTAEVAQIGALPVWAFNGDSDGSTTLADAQRVTHALAAAGGDVRLTVLPGVDHGGTQAAAFSTPGLWEWLEARRRPAP
jgi:pimeloyl-ACP methyl ester carboxylesterase